MKESDKFPFYNQISLLCNSKIRHSSPISKVQVERFSISEVQSDYFINRLGILEGVVVAAVSEKKGRLKINYGKN